MTTNEAAIRTAYQVAEDRDIAGWVNSFTEDGTFTDESIGVTYRDPQELGRTHAATVKRMNAPCCDVFQLRNGKTQSFNSYPWDGVQKQLGPVTGPGRNERHAV